MLLIHGMTGGVGSELLRLATADLDPTFITVMGVTRQECDVTDPESIAKFYSNLNRVDPFPGAPLYVINATGACETNLIENVGLEEYERQMAVTAGGAFNLTRTFAQEVRFRHSGAALIHLSSVVRRLGLPGTSVYAMGKGAIEALVVATAPELARDGATINAIEMGYFNTGLIEMVPEKIQKRIKRDTPVRRFGEVSELWTICSAVLKTSFATGEIIPLTGGL